MKRNFVFLIIVNILVFVGFVVLSLKTLRQPTVKIGNTTVFVEIAKTPEESSRGLSYRKSMPENHGMLFVFPNKSYQTFWMRGMNFNLDFIWIADNEVVEITYDVPAPDENIPEEALPIYRSKVPVTAMIEVNGGLAKEEKIKIGDSVAFGIK